MGTVGNITAMNHPLLNTGEYKEDKRFFYESKEGKGYGFLRHKFKKEKNKLIYPFLQQDYEAWYTTKLTSEVGYIIVSEEDAINFINYIKSVDDAETSEEKKIKASNTKNIKMIMQDNKFYSDVKTPAPKGEMKDAFDSFKD
jgi:hypothetical protein